MLLNISSIKTNEGLEWKFETENPARKRNGCWLEILTHAREIFPRFVCNSLSLSSLTLYYPCPVLSHWSLPLSFSLFYSFMPSKPSLFISFSKIDLCFCLSIFQTFLCPYTPLLFLFFSLLQSLDTHFTRFYSLSLSSTRTIPLSTFVTFQFQRQKANSTFSG